MNYKIGSTYIIDKPDDFKSYSRVNRLIFDKIETESWQVLSLNNCNEVTKIKLQSGRIISADDNGMTYLFSNNDIKYIVELLDALCIIVDDQGLVHYCNETAVEDSIKDILIKSSCKSVKVFKFDAEYQVKIEVIKT